MRRGFGLVSILRSNSGDLELRLRRMRRRLACGISLRTKALWAFQDTPAGAVAWVSAGSERDVFKEPIVDGMEFPLCPSACHGPLAGCLGKGKMVAPG